MFRVNVEPMMREIRRVLGSVEDVKAPQRSPRMYVLVRADLIPGLQAAQALHAATYLSVKDELSLYQHPTVTILAVEDEEALKFYAGIHRRPAGTPYGFMYREPDLDGEATAFACYSKGDEFKDLPLALSGYVPNPEDA